jgi:hypothetical protein
MKFNVTLAFLIAIGISAIFFVSCRKERVCSCSVVTSGTKQTQAHKAAVVSNLTFSLNLGLPLPPIEIPDVEISPERDTSYSTNFNYTNAYKANYDKISKRQMQSNCPSTFEETFSDGSTTIVPGTTTVITTESGKKTYKCKIE